MSVLAMRPTRSVTTAAAVSAMSSSWVGNTSRPIVMSEENPRLSACLAHSTRRRPGTSGIVLGRPTPMRMLALR
jgi:hypothetical protein